MFSVNKYSHIPFLGRELKGFLSDDSFMSRVWKLYGRELHHHLVEWLDSSETEFSSQFPVKALYVWVSDGHGLDPEWLSEGDGIYRDNEGEVIPENIKPSYSEAEQLAAYGLWLITEEMQSIGSFGDDDFGDDGRNAHSFEKAEVISHAAECMLLAYQALSYARTITMGGKPSAEDREKVASFYFSALGKRGSDKRHAPMQELKTWAVTKYRAGTWRSANKAAHTLKDAVIEHGKTIGADLSPDNAQRTIAEWFRKSV